MQKILVSVPNELAARIRTSFPARQRSRIISKLIEQEVAKRETALYAAALVLEENHELSQEMQEWEEAFGNDGLENEDWDNATSSKKETKK